MLIVYVSTIVFITQSNYIYLITLCNKHSCAGVHY